MLSYAALLHDIGIFIAYPRHAEHSAYLIRHAELLCFTDNDVVFIAMLALFHSNRRSKNYPIVANSDPETRRLLRTYALFLSIAENLDRLHRQLVSEAEFVCSKDGVSLLIKGKSVSPVELDAVASMQRQMKKVLGVDVEISVKCD